MTPFRASIRLALLYILLGVVWIQYSDAFLMDLTEDPEILSQLQTWKGWMYVAVTGVLLFFLLLYSFRKQQKLSERDPLTSLLNRFMFGQELEVLMERARKEDSDIAMFVLNLDRFSEINNAVNQQAGDRVLKQVAELLVAEVPDYALIARIGADEFAVALPTNTENSELLPKIQRVQQKIQAIVIPGYEDLAISARVGMARFPDHATTSKTLMTSAHLAVEQARKEGPGYLQVYNSVLGETAQTQMQLSMDIKNAIRNKELYVEYQPQFSCADKSITGVEVLVRWKHPTLGQIPPDRFIPLAELLGLVSHVARFVCQQALQELTEARLLGAEVPRLSMNISASDLKNEDCIRDLTEYFESFDISWESVQLEITETEVMQNTEVAVDVLSKLRDKGLSVSIDDFGTGYSSLGILRQLPVSELKIDRTFINDIERDESDRTIIRTIIAMAREMNLRIVAEGVETEKQMKFMCDHHCNELQGYLLARPMRIDALKEFISSYTSSGSQTDTK